MLMDFVLDVLLNLAAAGPVKWIPNCISRKLTATITKPLRAAK